MYGHSWKKVIVSSFALGVAGIMTCISALLSDLVPTWSVLAFIAVLIPLGLAIVGILAGFVWLCDKFEDYLNEKKDKRLDGGKRKSDKEISPNDQQFHNGANSRYIKYASLWPRQWLKQYTSTLRGSGPAKPYHTIIFPPTQTWHGQ
ncbi:MAG: hypothetical protein ABSA26_02455 [Thermoguttaceae bacterium]|jgi:uncharacterized membrane protein YciS (DUF1049 family)